MASLCWNGGDCEGRDPYLSPQIKVWVIISHVIGYPIIFYGLYVVNYRKTDLIQRGANWSFLFFGFVSLIIQTDWFIADHVNSLWLFTPDSNIYAHIGYVGIVFSNVLLALGFMGYTIPILFLCRNMPSHQRTNNGLIFRCCSSKVGSTFSGIIGVAMCVSTAIIYPYCKSFAVLMTLISGFWSVTNLRIRFGADVFIYTTIGVVAVIISGTCTAILNYNCVQWIHIIVATGFGVQAFCLALAIKNFEVIGSDSQKRQNADFYSLSLNDNDVNGSI